MKHSAETRHHRARIANLTARKADSADVADARRDFKAARLADWINDALSTAPPLTAEQRHDLANLLRSGAIR